MRELTRSWFLLRPHSGLPRIELHFPPVYDLRVTQRMIPLYHLKALIHTWRLGDTACILQDPRIFVGLRFGQGLWGFVDLHRTLGVES